MSNKFASVSIVYKAIKDAHDLGMSAYRYEREGSRKKFQEALQEAYYKIKCALPLVGECSDDIRSTVYTMAAWFAHDLGKKDEAKEYATTGLAMCRNQSHSEKLTRVISSL